MIAFQGGDLRSAQDVLRAAVPGRTEYDIGSQALHPGSIGPIWRAIIRWAAHDTDRLLKEVSARSTRLGLIQDLFASGKDIAGITDALRWKSLRMPLAYNRNLAAKARAVGRLARKLE